MPRARTLALRTGSALLASALALGGLLVASPASSAPAPAQLVVSRVGTPGGTIGSGPSPVALVTVNADGSASSTAEVDLPVAASGSNRPLTLSGTSDAQGGLSLAADGSGLAIAGFGATPGQFSGDPKDQSAATAPREAGWIGADGSVDTSTVLTGLYDKDNVRSAATADGSSFYVAGKKGKESAADGVVLAARGSSSATIITDQDSNFRTVGIAGGRLWASSDKTATVGVSTLGTGLPTAAVGKVTTTPISTAAVQVGGAAGTPNGFALLDRDGDGQPDTAYVVVETSGIYKYALSGGSWMPRGSIPGAFQSIAARVQGGSAELYTLRLASPDANDLVAFTDTAASDADVAAGAATTLATAPAGTAFRGVALAPTGWNPPGSGSGGGGPGEPAPTIAADQPGLPLAVGDPTNPTLGLTVGSTDADPASLTVAVTANSAPAVAVDPVVSGTGERRTLAVTPGSVGTSTLTLTVTDPATEETATTTVVVGVSAATPGLTDARYLDGAADASSAIDVGDGYMIVADDETNTLRLYSRTVSGQPVRTWNFNSAGGFSGEGDLEAAARVGDTIYWMGSHSNNKSSVYKPQRSVLFTTTVTGSGADTQLAYGGKYTGLRQDLLAWDAAHGDRLGLDVGCSLAGGTHPDVSAGCNIEGFEVAPDDPTTGLIGFRSPLVGGKAVVVPVHDLPGLIGASTGAASFGDPILLDLGGRTIRELRRNDLGQYLITAGVPDDGDAALGWALYRWDGRAGTAPVLLRSLPSDTGAAGQEAGSWESIVSVPDLDSASTVQLITDNGTTVFYGDGTAGKDISPAALQKSRTATFALAASALPGGDGDGDGSGSGDGDGSGDGGSTTPATLHLSATTVTAGGTLRLTGAGFTAGERVSVVLHSTPVTLATTTASATGSIALSVTIPASTPAGAHTLVVTGADSGLTASAALTVAAAAADPALASTGSDLLGGLGLASAFVIFGLIAWRMREWGNGHIHRP